MKLDNHFSSLKDYSTLLDLCVDIFGCSKTLVKKELKKGYQQKVISKGDEISLPFSITNHFWVNPQYVGPNIKVLFEDDCVMALDKPAKVHSLPLGYHDQDNCVSYLREKNFLGPCDGRDFGLLHRLDYETSGVLFVVKNPVLCAQMRQEFAKVALSKQYLAVVEGNFKQDGNHKHFLSPSGPKGHKMRVSEDKGDFLADLDVKIIAGNVDHSLLSVSLNTGIRHQIRAQLAYLGHPIVGDPLYGGAKEERLFLHSYRYKIEVEGKSYEVSSTNPKLFERFFDLNGIE